MRDTCQTVTKPRYLRPMKKSILALILWAVAGSARAAPPSADAVVTHYADLAAAVYDDSATASRKLQGAVDAFLAHPTAETLAAARAAWKEARVPYLQSEAFRFANSVVDDWEPRVNAWPLDEGLIDYVAPSYGTQSEQNPLYALNAVANTKLRLGAKIVDAGTIDTALLRKLAEAEGVRATSRPASTPSSSCSGART